MEMHIDAEIINRIKSGKIEDYKLLMDRYKGMVVAIAGKRIPANDVEHVVQDIFVNAYRSLSSWSGKKPFANWLSRIAMRGCCDYWRQQKRGHCNSSNDLNEDHLAWLDLAASSASQEHFDSVARKHEAGEIITWALNKLSPEDRTVLEMIYFEGIKLNEAAKVMEWSLAKTKVKAMRARAKMRKLIMSLTEHEL